MLATMWQDITYGLRMFVKNPSFTIISVIALGVGIGANTAIFSVVNAVMLRPLPYKDPDHIVNVFRVQPPIMRGPISRPDFFEWQEQQQVFQNLAAFQYATYNLTGIDEAQRISGVEVTEQFFPLLGINPSLGRFFLPSEDQPGAQPVAVISYGLWQKRFGGDPGLLGRTISLNGQAFNIVGVAPASFGYPARSDIWTPAKLNEQKTDRGSNYLKIIGRLKDGVSEQQAEAQMNQIAASLAAKYPESDANLKVDVSPLLADQVRDVKSVLWVLLGAVAFVLLIACANVANLLLARATSRQKEIAVRTALGATRWRIARQLLTESVLLAVLSSMVGVLLSMWGVQLLVSLAPENLPRVGEINIDPRVMGFTLLVALATGILFGLAPAIQVSKTDLNDVLKEGTRGAATGGKRRSKLRRLLVVTEIAMSFILLVSAGLLIESIHRVGSVSPGFNPDKVLTASVSFPRDHEIDFTSPRGIAESAEQNSRFLAAAEQNISTLPGVAAVGVINDLPVSGDSDVNGDFNIEGRPKANPGEAPVAEFKLVTPHYFQAIGIPVVRGRIFETTLRPGDPVQILINDTLAKRYFPGEDAIGKRINVLDDQPHEVIGIVGDARQFGLDRPVEPEIYFPFSQQSFGSGATIVVGANVDPATLADSVRRVLRETNRDAPVSNIRTMTDVMAVSVAQRRFNTILMSSFAGVALLLASIGLYGVISYSFAQRTQEIGIRMALGARAGNVLGMVLGFGLKLAVIGVAIGIAGSILLTRLLSSMLFDVSATDPLTMAGGALFLVSVAVVAAYVPARRATRIDPMTALRYE